MERQAMRFYLTSSLLLTALILLAVTNSTPGTGKLTVAERAAARQLYIARCTACHRLYDRAGYSDDEWKLWMAKMSRKARLDTNQEQLLNAYLGELRSAVKPEK
jgi:broad-specificity NMP kinase